MLAVLIEEIAMILKTHFEETDLGKTIVRHCNLDTVLKLVGFRREVYLPKGVVNLKVSII